MKAFLRISRNLPNVGLSGALFSVCSLFQLSPRAAAVLGTVPLGRLTFENREWGLQVVFAIADFEEKISLLKPMAHHLGAVQLHLPEVRLSCSSLSLCLHCLMHCLISPSFNAGP
jgi:hypothetical protein